MESTYGIFAIRTAIHGWGVEVEGGGGGCGCTWNPGKRVEVRVEKRCWTHRDQQQDGDRVR